VNVSAGSCAVPSANNTGSLLCVSDAVEPVTLNAAPGSGLNRIDLIICQTRGNDTDGGANNDFLFTFVTGTAAASPVAPAVPVGALVLAQVFVGTGVASIVAGNITDLRAAGTRRWWEAWGVLDYKTATVAQGPVNATVDLTGLTSTLTYVAGRRIKITGHVQFISTTQAIFGTLYIVRDAVTLQYAQIATPGSSQPANVVTIVVDVPTAGAHTYKLQGQTGSTGGQTQAGTNQPSVLLIEDVGPAQGPP